MLSPNTQTNPKPASGSQCSKPATATSTTGIHRQRTSGSEVVEEVLDTQAEVKRAHLEKYQSALLMLAGIEKIKAKLKVMADTLAQAISSGQQGKEALSEQSYSMDMCSQEAKRQSKEQNRKQDVSIQELKAELNVMIQKVDCMVKECDLVRLLRQELDCIAKEKEAGLCLKMAENRLRLEMSMTLKQSEDAIKELTADRDALRAKLDFQTMHSYKLAASLQETDARCEKLQQEKVKEEATIEKLEEKQGIKKKQEKQWAIEDSDKDKRTSLLRKLSDELVATREERDKFSFEVAKLSANISAEVNFLSIKMESMEKLQENMCEKENKIQMLSDEVDFQRSKMEAMAREQNMTKVHLQDLHHNINVTVLETRVLKREKLAKESCIKKLSAELGDLRQHGVQVASFLASVAEKMEVMSANTKENIEKYEKESSIQKLRAELVDLRDHGVQFTTFFSSVAQKMHAMSAQSLGKHDDSTVRE